MRASSGCKRDLEMPGASFSSSSKSLYEEEVESERALPVYDVSAATWRGKEIHLRQRWSCRRSVQVFHIYLGQSPVQIINIAPFRLRWKALTRSGNAAYFLFKAMLNSTA